MGVWIKINSVNCVLDLRIYLREKLRAEDEAIITREQEEISEQTKHSGIYANCLGDQREIIRNKLGVFSKSHEI